MITFPPPNFEYVLRLVKTFLRPPHDVENIAAELVLYSLETDNDLTYTTIKNKCIDEARRLRRDPLHWTCEVLQSKDSSSERRDEEACLRVEILERAFSRASLSSQEREILFLKYYKGLSHCEIASRLETPKWKVSTLVTSAMDKLKEQARRLK